MPKVENIKGMTPDDNPADNTVDELINPVTCAACGKVYDYYTEPPEVQEGGIHICPQCWDE